MAWCSPPPLVPVAPKPPTPGCSEPRWPPTWPWRRWPNPRDPAFGGYFDALARLPGVVAVGRTAGLSLVTAGPRPVAVETIAGADERYATVVDRPKVVEGRMPDPRRPHEAVATSTLARDLGLHDGSELRLVGPEPPGGSTGPDRPPGEGVEPAPPLTVRIVGIVVTRRGVVPPNAPNQISLIATPAFLHQFQPGAYDSDYTFVRLRAGTSRVAFQNAAQALTARYPATGGDLFVADQHDEAARVEHAIGPQAAALGAFALLAALAAVFVVGQIASRSVFVAATDNSTLRALGMSRGQLFVVALAQVAVTAVVGAVLAVTVAVGASSLMPIGAARIAEPYPGLAVNWAVLVVGGLVIVGALLAWVALPAWRLASVGTGIEQAAGTAGTDRPSRLVEAAMRSGAPPSAIVGARLALQPGRGRTFVPVRSALAGTTVAIAAVVTALTFATNLARLVNTPRLYGQTWELAVDSGFGNVAPADVEQVLNRQPGVTGWTFGDHGDVTIAGHRTPAVGLAAGKGPEAWPTLLEGRPARAPDEIVLGTTTLQAIHRRVGDTVDVALPAATGDPGVGGVHQKDDRVEAQSMRIVGRAVFAFFGRGDLTPTGLGVGAALQDPVPESAGFNFLLVRYAAGSGGELSAGRLRSGLAGIGACPTGDRTCGVVTAKRPVDINNYARVQGTPLALAGLLALLAVAMVGHVLVTSIRRR
ncbi:MAG: hypothetical protein M3256_25095, partial [Actinomycetota bacterium]|nr:hypothetical protein [Actinomycetota bacterium]